MSDKSKTTTVTKPAAPAKPVAAAKPAKVEKPKVESERSKKAAARGYTLPLVLKCTKTGKEVRYTSADYIDKVIAKSPGKTLESLRATYISREGRKINADAEKAAKALKKEQEKAAKAAATPAPAATTV